MLFFPKFTTEYLQLTVFIEYNLSTVKSLNIDVVWGDSVAEGAVAVGYRLLGCEFKSHPHPIGHTFVFKFHIILRTLNLYSMHSNVTI